MTSYPGGNFLPTVTAVIEDLSREYESKCKSIWDDIRSFNELLKPVSIKADDRASTSKASPKMFTENLSFNDDSKKKTKPDFVQEGTTERIFLAQHFLDKGIPKELSGPLKSIDDYIKSRAKPSKNIEKNKFLTNLENSWALEHKTYQIFEPDLLEELLKYLAVIEEKPPVSRIPVWPTKKMLDVPTTVREEEDAILSAQDKVNKALSKDLSQIDLTELKGNKKLLVTLHRLVTALSDITQLRSNIIVHGDTWMGSTGD